MLALASAALFGSMTVALRFALARAPDAEAGALLTIVVALRRHAAVRRRRRARPRRRLAVPARRRARSGRIAAALHPRRPRRGPVADVGDRRHGAALLGRDRARAARRACEGRRDRRRAPDRRRRDRARARAGPAGAREVDRARRSRSPRRSSSPCATTSSGISRCDTDVEPALAAAATLFAGGADGRCLAARHAAPAAERGPRRVRPGRASASASRTCASSRRTTAAASRSSRRSSRPSRSGASALSALLLRRHELVGPRLFAGAALVVAGGILIGVFR